MIRIFYKCMFTEHVESVYRIISLYTSNQNNRISESGEGFRPPIYKYFKVIAHNAH